MDNVDKMCRARRMTISNRHKDYHWCNAYAVRNRITAGYTKNMFDSDMHSYYYTYSYALLYIKHIFIESLDDKPQGKIALSLLRNLSAIQRILSLAQRCHAQILISRVLVQRITVFHMFKCLVNYFLILSHANVSIVSVLWRC